MRRNYQPEPVDEDGWTVWIHPLPNYRMACCDCGLVHEMEFRIDEQGRIVFRARRSERSTAAVRRHKRRDSQCPPISSN